MIYMYSHFGIVGVLYFLVTRYYARKNKLKGIKISYELFTVGNIVAPQNSILYEIPIEDREGRSHIIKA